MRDRPLGYASSCLDLFVRPRRTALACALIGACLTLPVASAVAQAPATDPTRDASARALFEEGVRWAEQQEWTEAEDRFRRALTLRASPVIAYNLANVLVPRGKLVEASELLRYVETDDKADLELKQNAHALESKLAARIARIVIEVRDLQSGDVIALDGAPLHDAQLDVEIPIDPGSHQLQATRAGQLLSTRTVDVPEGGVEHVTLTVPVNVLSPSGLASAGTEHAPAAPNTALPQSDSAPSSRPVTQRWWFWTGAAVVVAAAVVVGVAAASSGSQAEHAYRGDFTPGSLSVQVAR